MTNATKPRKAPVSAAHKADIAKIAQVMKEAAMEHGLCDVFYDAVAELNDVLTVPLDVSPDVSGQYAYIYVRIELQDFADDGVRFKKDPDSWRNGVEAVDPDAFEKAILARLAIEKSELEDWDINN